MGVIGKQPRASLILQMLFYLTGIYFVIFFGIEVFLLVYKNAVVGYPSNLLALDVCILLIYVLVEIVQLVLGSAGNLSEGSITLGGSILLLVGTVFLSLYYLLWQTYIMRLDIIVVAIMLGLQGLQLLFSAIAIVGFANTNY